MNNPPITDRAVENGKSFFDVLFEQDRSAPVSRAPSIQQPRTITQDPSLQESTGDYDYENNDQKNKKHGTHIKEGVKNIVKSGIENIKSVLPSKHRESKDQIDSLESNRRSSTSSTDSQPNDPQSPSLVDTIKSKFRRASSPTNVPEQRKQSQPYERLWQTSSQREGREMSNATHFK